jgi:hypothetical protein
VAKKKIEIKSWKESRTVIFNVVALGVVVAEAVLGQTLGLPEQLTEVLAIVVAAGNMYLRFHTSQPIR